jgi:hypothetical protein
MNRQETPNKTGLNRRAALSGAGAAALGIGLGPVRAAAQEADLASHPIVGAWMVLDPPQGGPLLFHADGTVVLGWSANFVDPSLGVTFQGPGMGAWEPTEGRRVRATIYQVLTDLDANFVGTFMIDSVVEVSDDGQTFTDRYDEAQFIQRDETGAVTADFNDTGGMVLTAARITPGARIAVPPAPAPATPTS